MVHGRRYLVYDLWWMVHGIWYVVCGMWYYIASGITRGTCYVTCDVWHMAYRQWNVVSGIWCTVCYIVYAMASRRWIRCLWKETYFMAAFALQTCSRNRSPVPDLMFRTPISPHVSFSGGVFFSQTPVSYKMVVIIIIIIPIPIPIPIPIL